MTYCWSLKIALLMTVTTTACADYPANDTYRCTKCLPSFVWPGGKSFKAERSGVRAGWESIISLATARLDPFSVGLSPASHQLLLRPAAPPRRAGMQDEGAKHGLSSGPGSPGTGMLLGATRGGDEPVFRPGDNCKAEIETKEREFALDRFNMLPGRGSGRGGCFLSHLCFWCNQEPWRPLPAPPHHLLPTSNTAAACGAPGLGDANGFRASEKANDCLIGPLHVTCVLAAGLVRDQTQGQPGLVKAAISTQGLSESTFLASSGALMTRVCHLPKLVTF